MANIGIINLELNPEESYLANFLENLERVSEMDLTEIDYRSLDGIDDSIDIVKEFPRVHVFDHRNYKTTKQPN